MLTVAGAADAGGIPASSSAADLRLRFAESVVVPFLRDLHSRRGAAEVERGPEAWCRFEGVEQHVAFHPEQHRGHLGGDGGIPGGTIEQAALTEAVARTEMHNGPAVTVNHDETIHDGVEGIG